MEQQHLVQKYIFDVEFDSENKAFQFQDQVAAHIKNKLLALTEEVFNEFSNDQLIKIDKLALDLGEVYLENFEEETYARLKSILSDKLGFLIYNKGINIPGESVEFISQNQSDLKIIEYFLLNGSLPWSASKNDPEFSIRKLLNRCIDENPAETKSLLLSLAFKEESRLRIIRQFEDSVLWNILKLWDPSELPKIKRFYADLVQLFNEKPLIKNYFSEYRELIWRFLIHEVIMVGNHKYNDTAWVKGFMVYVSKEINISEEAVIKTFHSSIIENNKAAGNIRYQTSFPQMTVELMKKTDEFSVKDGPGLPEQARKKAEEMTAEELKQEQLRRKKNYLINFLKASFYSDSDFDNEFKSHVEKAEVIIKELADLHPTVLKKIFSEGNFDIKTYRSQQVFQLFNNEVQEWVLREIFKISQSQFEIIRNETSKQALILMLETHLFPHSILPLSLKKPALEKLFIDVYKNEKKEVDIIIKKVISIAEKKHSGIEELKKILSAKTIKILFADYSALVSARSSAIRVAESKEEDILVKLKELKTEASITKVLQYLLKEKSLPEKADYTISQLIEKFISEYKETALMYFASIHEKEMAFIKKTVLPALLKNITQRRDELKKAVNEIKKTIPLLEASSQESTDPVYNFKEPVNDEPIYISNAGLVIFHPYLNRFFNMLQLLEKRAFKDEYSAHKAVYILQYLVNKGLNSEEHELVLNKLLCGIDLKVPLIRDIEITEEDKNTCESLIEGVIQNWPILKKTSNDNFRASFLMREGRLTRGPADWKLKVEERGYDILVEKLPWSISMIRLAWMKNMINVEWK